MIEDPIDNLNLAKKLIKNQEINRAVSASFGFGGHDSALVFERVNNE